MMNCEEFELRGLDLDRADADPGERAAAIEHLQKCPHCSAMLESWRKVKGDLRLLREATRADSAPARVEMRLKQELRTRREARVPRRTLVTAAWAVAAAAVLAVSIGWFRTHNRPATVSGRPATAASALPVADSPGGETVLVADSDFGDFTQIPGSLQGESGEESVMEVRMQLGELERFGFTVDPDQAAEWVHVDFLVGEDGLPQAVRLHQDTQAVAESE